MGGGGKKDLSRFLFGKGRTSRHPQGRKEARREMLKGEGMLSHSEGSLETAMRGSDKKKKWGAEVEFLEEKGPSSFNSPERESF